MSSQIREQVDRLIARYRGLSPEATPHERALLAKEVLDTAITTTLAGQKVDRRKWLAEALGVGEYSVICDLSLLAFGKVAMPFWERVRGDMLLKTAVDLMRQARDRAATERIGVQAAIERVIAEYDALPNITSLPDGKILRKRSSAAMPREAPQPAKKPKRKPAATAAMGGEPEHDARGFRTALRALVSDHFRAHLQGLDPMLVEMTWKSLEDELKVVLDAHIGKIRRLRSAQNQRTVMVSRGKIIAAYRALSMEPVAPGAPIVLKDVKAKFRQLASFYHPDKSGTEETRQAYEAAVAARDILEEAHDAQQTNGKGGPTNVSS